LKLESQPNQKQKSRKAAVHASDDLENPQKLQPKSERNSEDKSRDENPIKTSGMVSQRSQNKGKSVGTSELKVEIVENSNRCASQKPRKRHAPKLFRKKAF
jgi:hypothetical protein